MTDPLRNERVDVLFRVTDMADVDNVLTWQVDGRAPTGAEVRLLKEITPQDALDVTVLLGLHLELLRRVNAEEWGGAS